MPINEDERAQVASRIRFLIGQQGLSQAAFARKLGIDPGNMSNYLNGRLPVTPGLINRIAADMGVSKHWLATGYGLPFEKETDYCGAELPPSRTPIYNIDVTAGTRELSREFTSERIMGYMDLPQLSPDTVIVRVNGDSMEPEILDGSFVAIRTVSDPTTIFWGQIYVVVLDDFRLVKHVRRATDDAFVILRSANGAYDDMLIERSKIRRLYMVEAVLNLSIRC